MSNLYYKGDNVFLYVKFFNSNQEAKSVENAEVRILHDKNGTIFEDLAWTSLNKMSDNEYFYNYKIPYDADLGQYQVIYAGEVDGKDAFVMETLHIISKSDKHFNTIKLYGYILDIRTNVPLIDSTVKIIDSSTNEMVFQSLSNDQGYWEAYIYPGDYKFIFIKSGFLPLEITAQIGEEYNEMQFNNIGLESEKYKKKGNGIFSISDKYVFKSGQPIVGLNISIFNVFNPNETVAEDITNDEGKWECFLDPGMYLLKIKGESNNKNFNKTLRLKVNEDGSNTFEDLSKNIAMANDSYINNGTGSIIVSDKIIDKNNNPIIDVQVNAFKSNDLNNIIAQTYTNVLGEWQLKLNSGNYTIEYYHPKYKIKTENKNV